MLAPLKDRAMLIRAAASTNWKVARRWSASASS